jgi:hypothetical protein
MNHHCPLDRLALLLSLQTQLGNFSVTVSFCFVKCSFDHLSQFCTHKKYVQPSCTCYRPISCAHTCVENARLHSDDIYLLALLWSVPGAYYHLGLAPFLPPLTLFTILLLGGGGESHFLGLFVSQLHRVCNLTCFVECQICCV